MVMILIVEKHIDGEIESINICKSCPFKETYMEKFNEH